MMSSSEGDATSNNLRGDRGSAYGDGDNDVVKEDWKKGSWSKSEDEILLEYVKRFGAKNWNEVWKNTSLKRCGQSCRLRWANYLNPDLKKGAFSVDEVNLITELHKKHGNRWSHIASQVPGRTGNEIKNFWNTKMKRFQHVNLPFYPEQIADHCQLTKSFPSLSSSPSQYFASYQYQSTNYSHSLPHLFPFSSPQTSNTYPIGSDFALPLMFHMSPPSNLSNQHFQSELSPAISQTMSASFGFNPSPTMGSFQYPFQTSLNAFEINTAQTMEGSFNNVDTSGFCFNPSPTLEGSFNNVDTSGFCFNPSPTLEGSSNLIGSSINFGINIAPFLGGPSSPHQTIPVCFDFNTIPCIGGSSDLLQTTPCYFTAPSIGDSTKLMQIGPTSVGFNNTPFVGESMNLPQTVPDYSFGVSTTPCMEGSSNMFQTIHGDFGFNIAPYSGGFSNSLQTKPNGFGFHVDDSSNPLETISSGFYLDLEPTMEDFSYLLETNYSNDFGLNLSPSITKCSNPLGFFPTTQSELYQNQAPHLLNESSMLQGVIEKSKGVVHFEDQRKEISLKGKDKVIYESNAELMEGFAELVDDSSSSSLSMGFPSKGHN